jgi:hypothetical protein
MHLPAIFQDDFKVIRCGVLVAHAFNHSYSGGRDQEDRSSTPAQENSSQNPIWKKNHHKKGLVEWLKVYALSSNHSTTKINKYINRKK